MLVRDLSRRSFLHGLTGGSLAAFTTPGLFAQQLVDTGTTTEGPFYPDVLPLDPDNDLLIINDSMTPAVGDITHLTGRVLTRSGQVHRHGSHRSVVPRARSRASGWCRCHLRARGAHGRSCPPASPTAMTHIAIH